MWRFHPGERWFYEFGQYHGYFISFILSQCWYLDLGFGDRGTGIGGKRERREVKLFPCLRRLFLKCFRAMGRKGGTYTTETNSTKRVPALGKMVGAEVLESLS